MRFAALLALTAALACLAGCRARAEGHNRPGTAAATTAAGSDAEANSFRPEFVDIFGRPVQPFEDPDTQAIVLIFTIPDCPIANSYLPLINRIAADYGNRGIPFILLQVDPSTTLDAARRHAEEYQIQLPVALDTGHSWVKRAGAIRTPEAGVFSKQGKLLYRGRIDDRYAAVGKKRNEATCHDLANALDAILAHQPVPVSTTESVGCYIPE